MDKTALVGLDIERGSQIIRALDDADLKPSVALWAYLPEYEDWRLIIASRKLDSFDPRSAYRTINDSLLAKGITVEQTPPIVIRSVTDPFIKDLRGMFAKTARVEGMRLGGQTIGGRFLEEAYVYRIR